MYMISISILYQVSNYSDMDRDIQIDVVIFIKSVRSVEILKQCKILMELCKML